MAKKKKQSFSTKLVRFAQSLLNFSASLLSCFSCLELQGLASVSLAAVNSRMFSNIFWISSAKVAKMGRKSSLRSAGALTALGVRPPLKMREPAWRCHGQSISEHQVTFQWFFASSAHHVSKNADLYGFVLRTTCQCILNALRKKKCFSKNVI